MFEPNKPLAGTRARRLFKSQIIAVMMINGVGSGQNSNVATEFIILKIRNKGYRKLAGPSQNNAREDLRGKRDTGLFFFTFFVTIF